MKRDKPQEGSTEKEKVRERKDAKKKEKLAPYINKVTEVCGKAKNLLGVRSPFLRKRTAKGRWEVKNLKETHLKLIVSGLEPSPYLFRV